jgi:predicted RND superfamily exporter protein
LVLPVAAAAALCIPWLRIEDALGRFFPANHPYTQAAAHLQRTRGWDGVMPLVVTTAAAPGIAATLASDLATLPEVARVERGADLVAYLRQGLDPATAAMVERHASADDSYRAFYSPHGEERLNVYLRDSSVGAARAVMGRAAALCPPPACYAAGPLPIFVDFSEAVVRSLFASFASSLLVVGAFLAFYLRLKRQRPVWPVLVASFWGPVVMAGLMALLRIPVNFVSCFFAAVLVSLSGDNAIHYIYAAGRRPLAQGIAARAHGSVEIAAAMIAVTLLFLASAFAPPRTLGVVLSIGLLVNLLGDLFVLRLLVGDAGADAN